MVGAGRLNKGFNMLGQEIVKFDLHNQHALLHCADGGKIRIKYIKIQACPQVFVKGYAHIALRADISVPEIIHHNCRRQQLSAHCGVPSSINSGRPSRSA